MATRTTGSPQILNTSIPTIFIMRLVTVVALVAFVSVSLGNPSIICMLTIVTVPRQLLGPFQLKKLLSLTLPPASFSMRIDSSQLKFVAKTKIKARLQTKSYKKRIR